MLAELRQQVNFELSKKKAKNTKFGETARQDSLIQELQGRINRIKSINNANRRKLRFADE